MEEKTIISIGTSSIEYDIQEAATPIKDLIAALQEAMEDGATHVVGTSGNYRGAKWVRIDGDYEVEEV